MTINNPPRKSEYEPPASEIQYGLIDRFLIRIGDIVIQNFAFLVFITVIWGLFLLLFFGGIVLIYTVGERFRELDQREQKRVILYEQQLDQILAPTVPKKKTVAKLDESQWFMVLNNTADAATINQPSDNDPIDDLAVSNFLIKQPEYATRQLTTDENIWQVKCGGSGFVIEASYPCPITQSQLLEPTTLGADIAISN